MTVESLGATVSTSLQNVLERLARSNNLPEIHLAPNFFFEVELLLCQLVCEFGDLLISQRVCRCDANLACSLAKKVDIVWAKGTFSPAPDP
jgi:hypothetical protein